MGRRVDDDTYDQLVDCYRQGMSHRQAAKAAGVTRNVASRYFRFGKTLCNGYSVPGADSRRLPISVILKQEKEATRTILGGEPSETISKDAFMNMIEKTAVKTDEDHVTSPSKAVTVQPSIPAVASPSLSIPEDENPKNIAPSTPLWYRQNAELKLDTRQVKEALQPEKDAVLREMTESLKETIISQTTETISAVEDRLDSIRYARAVKGMLAQQAPMVKKAITVIGRVIEDISEELPSLPTMQKVNVLQRVSGYITTWQGSVEAAIRLERLLLGEPESHVSVSEMTQEDALRKLERLKMLAEQAKNRVVSDS